MSSLPEIVLLIRVNWGSFVVRFLSPFLLLTLVADTSAAGNLHKISGTLRLARPADPQSLDPAICYDIEALLIERLIFQGLLDFDDNAQMYAKQARDWNVSPDHKTYTFHLRPGVRFANGREVEAADYVYALERVIDPRTGSPGQSFFTVIAGAHDFEQHKTNHISGLRARDNRTLEIELTQPDFTFAFKMGMTFATAVPREQVEAEGKSFWLHPFGSGPYQVTAWERGIRIGFARSPHVNQPDEGFFKSVEVMIGGDRMLHAMMLERGQLDMVFLVQLPDIVRLSRDAHLRKAIQIIPAAATDFLALNNELPPFDNVKIRQAAAHAIDKAHLERLMAGSAVRAKGILPPLMPGYNAAIEDSRYDPKLAKKMLDDARYGDGAPFDLYYSDDDPRWEKGAIAVESDFRAIGLKAILKKVTLPALFTAIQTRRTAACAYFGWGEDYPDPSNFLDVLFNGSNIVDTDGNNYSYYNNPAVNALLAEADRVTVPADRYARYQEIEKLILRDAPTIPLTHPSVPVLIAPTIGGFKPHPVWKMRPECWWRE
jgi:oligopeptide transport system substrate-binding protein